MASCHKLKVPRRRLAKIRCVQECIDSFRHNRPLPSAICYVPKELECKINQYWGVSLYAEPNKESAKLAELPLTPNSRLFVAGEQHCNSHGQWCKVLKTSLKVLIFISIYTIYSSNLMHGMSTALYKGYEL